jgi:hypothetical protein
MMSVRATAVGGVEIIGVDGEAYRSTFYDSFGNVVLGHDQGQGSSSSSVGNPTAPASAR